MTAVARTQVLSDIVDNDNPQSDRLVGAGLVLLLTSCTCGGATSVSQYYGHWRKTTPTEPGVEITLAVPDRFSISVAYAGNPAEVYTGTFSLTGDRFTFVVDPNSRQLSGSAPTRGRYSAVSNDEVVIWSDDDSTLAGWNGTRFVRSR